MEKSQRLDLLKMTAKQRSVFGKAVQIAFSLNYEIHLIPDQMNGGFIAEMPELSGCVSTGRTEETAIKNLKEEKLAWIKSVILKGGTLPLPKSLSPRKLELVSRAVLRNIKEAKIV
jgi:predicted RNase H-like HicB family nuclease